MRKFGQVCLVLLGLSLLLTSCDLSQPLQDRLLQETSACANKLIAKEISQHFAKVVGGSPIWATLGNGKLPLYGVKTELGYAQKVLWIIEPTYKGTVTVQGFEVNDNTPLQFEAASAKPSRTLVLDSQKPGIPLQHQDAAGYWREWPSYLHIPKAGCYQLEATWKEGSWKILVEATN